MARVLVADDSIAVRKVAERLLTGAGIEVALAANAEEALAWLANERPDVVISDVIMPDKSGYDVCNFVRLNEGLANTPVLLISGIVNEEVTRQAESCRADGVLKKPFQGTSLQDRVLELLKKRQEQPAPAAAAPVAQPEPAPALAPPVEPPVSAFAFATAAASAPPEPSPAVEPPPLMEQPVAPPAPEPALTVAAEAAAVPPAAPKVYKITEEQLQTFRQSAGRIKELEALLAQEQARSAQLVRQAAERAEGDGRQAELEAKLAEAHQRLEQAAEVAARLEEAESRIRELEGLLTSGQGKPVQLALLSEKVEQGEARLRELEGLLAQEQARSAQLAEQASAAGGAVQRITELEALAGREQERADQLARQAASAQQLDARLSELERLLQEERAKSADLARQVSQLEQQAEQRQPQAASSGAPPAAGDAAARIVQLEEMLAREQTRSAYLLQRSGAFSAAEQRIKELEALLAQAAAPAPPDTADLERRVGEFQSLLRQEQEQAAALLQRVLETGQAVSEMQARLDEMGKRFADLPVPDPSL